MAGRAGPGARPVIRGQVTAAAMVARIDYTAHPGLGRRARMDETHAWDPGRGNSVCGALARAARDGFVQTAPQTSLGQVTCANCLRFMGRA
jgi:uncharacterized membrane protein YadS